MDHTKKMDENSMMYGGTFTGNKLVVGQTQCGKLHLLKIWEKIKCLVA